MLIVLSCSNVFGQYFWSDDDWYEDWMVKVKYTRLFIGEVATSFKVGDNYGASNWVNINFGLGFPNSQKHYMPFMPAPEGGQAPPDDAFMFSMKWGAGWTHYFTHFLGFYTDVSWCPIFADAGQQGPGGGGGPGGEEQSNMDIITSLCALECGVNVNAFNRLVLSGGIAYYCKEKPQFVVGVGFCW